MLLVDEQKLSGLSDDTRMRYLLQWLQQLPHSIKETKKVS